MELLLRLLRIQLYDFLKLISDSIVIPIPAALGEINHVLLVQLLGSLFLVSYQGDLIMM